MRKGLIDKISLTLLILLVLTIGFTIIEWIRNGFQTHKHWVYSVDVNDDGTIASASDNQILIWRKTKTRKNVHRDNFTINNRF